MRRIIAILALFTLLCVTTIAVSAPAEIPNPARWMKENARLDSVLEADGSVVYVWRVVTPLQEGKVLQYAYLLACEEKGFALREERLDHLGLAERVFDWNGQTFTLRVGLNDVQLTTPKGAPLEAYPPQEAVAPPDADAEGSDPPSFFDMIEPDAAPPDAGAPQQKTDTLPDIDDYCPTCYGTGHCRDCAGSGRIIDILKEGLDMLSTCARCGGDGRCVACGGSGLVEE